MMMVVVVVGGGSKALKFRQPTIDTALMILPISMAAALLVLLTMLAAAAAATGGVSSGDAEALLALKSSVDRHGSLHWRKATASMACSQWKGVKECSPGGRVTKLVLEFLNLTGTLPPEILSAMDGLRVLSLKSNSLSGPIPDLSSLRNLKTLYLNDNLFSGQIPSSIAALRRLKIVVLSGNRLSGTIPPSLAAALPRLYMLYLQDNRIAGRIPAFNQSSLRYLNVSNNELVGEIPVTVALSKFNLSSFSGNPALCGAAIRVPCFGKPPVFPPSTSPAPSSSIVASSSPPSSRHRRRTVAIIAGSVVGAVVALILIVLFLMAFKRNRKRRSGGDAGGGLTTTRGVVAGSGVRSSSKEFSGGDGATSAAEEKRGGFSWEAEGLGKLVFCCGNGGGDTMYSLEDLLKASAEILGRGTVGSTYKAVMESGFIVTVKRLKDSSFPDIQEFRQRMEELGRLRHPNIVPLRAYFQAKEERLLVYDYFPNGSLFSLIHGSRPSGHGKPLHWTSCMKIAEDVAAGLLYLHQQPGPLAMVHGNLKSSNILLGSDFESRLADYGLLRSPESPGPDEPPPTSSASSLFYRAPECRNGSSSSSAFTQASDVYGFGVLLLELLTGKTPFQDLVEEHGEDIPRWVRSVREEEAESGDDPASSGNEAAVEEKLGALMSVAMACVRVSPEGRPAAKDVLRMIREARAEVVVSSNSSDHSPGRWSDTVQSLPREYGGSEHLSFAERD